MKPKTLEHLNAASAHVEAAINQLGAAVGAEDMLQVIGVDGNPQAADDMSPREEIFVHLTVDRLLHCGSSLHAVLRAYAPDETPEEEEPTGTGPAGDEPVN